MRHVFLPRPALAYYVAVWNNRGNIASASSGGKRNETGPLGVSEASRPAAQAPFKTRLAVRSGRPVILAASPRSNSPRMAASSKRRPASGLKRSSRSAHVRSRLASASRSNSSLMNCNWSRQTSKNHAVKSMSARSDKLPLPPPDDRSRDRDGQIRRKRGDTKIGTLRDEYPGFAPGVRADMRLDNYLKRRGFDSLSDALGDE